LEQNVVLSRAKIVFLHKISKICKKTSDGLAIWLPFAPSSLQDHPSFIGMKRTWAQKSRGHPVWGDNRNCCVVDNVQ
jgi:hypothetical protein